MIIFNFILMYLNIIIIFINFKLIVILIVIVILFNLNFDALSLLSLCPWSLALEKENLYL